MKEYLNKIFSSWFSMIALFLLIVAISIATFIENSYDTHTAKQLIYNSLYFEAILLVLALLYIGLIIKKNLFSGHKIPQFVLHFSVNLFGQF